MFNFILNLITIMIKYLWHIFCTKGRLLYSILSIYYRVAPSLMRFYTTYSDLSDPPWQVITLLQTGERAITTTHPLWDPYTSFELSWLCKSSEGDYNLRITATHGDHQYYYSAWLDIKYDHFGAVYLPDIPLFYTVTKPPAEEDVRLVAWLLILLHALLLADVMVGFLFPPSESPVWHLNLHRHINIRREKVEHQ